MMNPATDSAMSVRTLGCESVALAGALVVALFVAYQGTLRVPLYSPDACSDQIAFSEAIALAHGAGRAGIVGITHFPNGHIYLLQPFILAGCTDIVQLRRVPVACIALAAGVWTLVLLRRARHLLLQVLALGATVLLFFQPGLREWHQCLHQQSYVLACVLMLFVMGASLRRARPALLVAGFVCGWLAYDWILLELAAVLVARWCFYCTHPPDTVWRRGRALLLDCAWFGAGVAPAVVLHFVQNAIYFGSVLQAWRDLGGAAATRAGMALGKTLNPGYYYEKSMRIGQDPNYSRWMVMGTLWQSLWTRQFTGSSMALFAALSGAYLLWCALVRRALPARAALLETSVVAVLVVVLGHLWCLVFPWSAYFHTFLIFRHLFVPFILLLGGIVWVATPAPACALARRWWPSVLVAILALSATGVWLVIKVEWLPARLAPRGENLLVNGTFARGLEGWSLWQQARVASNNVRSVSLGPTGTALCIANPEKHLLGVQQLVRLESGAVYRVSGAAHSFGVPAAALRGGRIGPCSFARAAGTVFGGRIGVWLPPQPEQEVLWLFEYNGWVARARTFTNQVTGTAVVYVHMGYGGVAATGAFTDVRFERL
jgi:hypothetical protein